MANNNYNNNNNGGKANALADYITVNERITAFYKKYPEGRITTEIVSWENGVILMKATCYRNFEDEKCLSNGFAYEKEDSTFINKTSCLENCETSSIGRCLAIAGFEIKKSIASREEVANAKHQQEMSKEKDYTPVSNEVKPTKEQMDTYFELLRASGLAEKSLFETYKTSTNRDVKRGTMSTEDCTKINNWLQKTIAKKIADQKIAEKKAIERREEEKKIS